MPRLAPLRLANRCTTSRLGVGVRGLAARKGFDLGHS